MVKIKTADAMDCETITTVLNSNLITQEEKNYFINMILRWYHIDNVEEEKNIEVETLERTNLYLDVERLIARILFDNNGIYDKYILFSDNYTYLNNDNEEEEIEELCSGDYQVFRSKEKAQNKIKELNLKDFKIIQLKELTELSGSSVYEWLEEIEE